MELLHLEQGIHWSETGRFLHKAAMDKVCLRWLADIVGTNILCSIAQSVYLTL